MKKFLVSLLLPTALAFHASIAPRPYTSAHTRPTATTKLCAFPERFERAVKCGEHYDLCDVDELNDLADELESYQGSFFEQEDNLRDKETKDREDLADLLRKEAELKLRQDYLKNANLFKQDVDEAVMIKERDEYIDVMDQYSEY